MPEFTHASDSDTANNRLQLRGHSQVGLCAEMPDKDAFPMDFQDETQDAWIIEVLCQIQYAVMRDCVWLRDALECISEAIFVGGLSETNLRKAYKLCCSLLILSF